MPMRPRLIRIFLIATLLAGHSVGAESKMPQELICRLPADPKAVDQAVFLEFCADLAQRLGAELLLNQAPDLSAKSRDRTIFVLEIAVRSGSSLKLDFAFGSAQAWRAGNEVRYDDLGFDVMDATINAKTIARLTDTLVGLSAGNN